MLKAAGVTALAVYTTNFLRPSIDLTVFNFMKVCIALMVWCQTLQTWLGLLASFKDDPRDTPAKPVKMPVQRTVMGKRMTSKDASRNPVWLPGLKQPTFAPSFPSAGNYQPIDSSPFSAPQSHAPIVGFSGQAMAKSKNSGGPLERLCGIGVKARPVNKKLEMIESSDRLYATEKIDAKMGEWSDNVRWWLAEMVVKRKIQEWDRTDVLMASYVKHCKKQFPNEKFDVLDTPQKQSAFFQENKSLLPKEWHNWIDERKKLEKELVLLGSTVQGPYVLERLADLNAKPFFGDYRWRGGAEWKNQNWTSLFPTDSEILMTYFRYFVERFTTPVIIFSESHFIQLSSANEKVVVGKHRFDRVAIVQSPRPPPSSLGKESERDPYYYLVFDPVGKRGDKTGAASDSSTSKPGEDLSEQFWGKSATTEGKPYPKWCPRPGPGNLFHCLALFAYFVKSRLKDTSLHDYLEHPDCLLLKTLT